MSEYRPTGFCPHCGYQISPGRCPECGREVSKPSRRSLSSRRRRRLAVGIVLLAIVGAGAAVYANKDEVAVRYAPTSLVRYFSGDGNGFAWWCSTVLSAQQDIAMSAEETASDSRLGMIRIELESLHGHPWAGAYEATNESLFLAPRSGFVYLSYGCTHSSASHGEVVEVTPQRIVLRSVATLKAFQIEPAILLRAEWQGHRYLIPDGDVVRFANCVNSRESGTPAWFLHRMSDRPQPEPRWPTLPSPFEHYILSEPLSAGILQITLVEPAPDDESGTCWQADVTLDKGARDGVFLGMMLYPTHRDAYLGAEVLDVFDHQARARFADCFSEGEKFDMPSPGWKFSTLGPFAELTGEYFNLEELHWFDGEADTEKATADSSHE